MEKEKEKTAKKEEAKTNDAKKTAEKGKQGALR